MHIPASSDLARAVADGFAALVDAQAHALDPAAARRAVRALLPRHPGLDFFLVAEREEHGGGFHYELAVGSEDAGGALVAYCPNREQPWMTRGATRMGDHLLRLDGVPIRLPDAMQLLDVAHDAGLAARVIDAMLLRQALEEHELADAPVDDAALQRALDDFRRARGLYEAAAMTAWLATHGLSQDGLERQLEDQVRAERLRDRVTADEIRACFAAHRADFDVVVAEIVELSRLADARALVAAAAEEPFAVVVERMVAERGARQRVERVRRGDGPAALIAELFAAPPGSPRLVRLERSFAVARALRAPVSAELDDETRRLVRDRLFARWLGERRARARIEWCWDGSAPEPRER
jgi:putative peptide maturation system protein